VQANSMEEVLIGDVNNIVIIERTVLSDVLMFKSITIVIRLI
jgi:hypothetical protein